MIDVPDKNQLVERAEYIFACYLKYSVAVSVAVQNLGNFKTVNIVKLSTPTSKVPKL